ncbi:hypothetical protein ACHAXR_010843 [Thalassiosira sp. AJA248-18]
MMFSSMPQPAPPSPSIYHTPTSSPARVKQKAMPPTPRGNDDLPSKTMTTAQYLRIHANASPAKLRAIIKELIFVHDDVDYLKRLVKDVGGMEYVYRFLWYDGPVPKDDNVGFASGADSSTNTRTEGGKQSQSNNVPKSVGCGQNSNSISKAGSSSKVVAKQYGRSWIQYCCYHDAHECLQWIFQEIVHNHLCKLRTYQEEQRLHQQRITAISSATMSTSERQTDVSGLTDNEKEGGREDHAEDGRGEIPSLVKIVQQLLEFPSSSYCGINYMAVATLRNSPECLALLIEQGGLDPNMPINSHGATAAHLAAWKDHVECLRILQSGTYACRFDDNDEFNEEESLGRTTTDDESNGQDDEQDFFHREAFSSVFTASGVNEKKWSADWTRTNALGETPLHVAAREGCLDSMKLFLDLAVASATTAMEEEETGKEVPCTIDFSIRNNEGMDCATVAAKHDQACIITLISEAIERLVDASIDGPVGLASQNVDFWQDPFSYFQPFATKQTPPPAPLHTNRRRATSEPFNIYSSERSLPAAAMKPPQSPGHQHHRHHSQQQHQQQCLPHNFPTLNLRNSLEEHNHEMPIHVAARRGNCTVIEALFASGNCDTTSRDSLGQTALHVAALEGHIDACQMFVYLAGDQFENFDVVDILGRTPLYIACSMGNPSLVRILASASNWRVICHERKKSPDGPLYVDVAHQPPLHAALVNDHVNTVSVLLECGVDVDQTDKDGRTAISAAAKLGLFEMCQMLILHGANVNKRSTRGGPTPFQKAKKYKHQDVADLLYEFGARG